MYDGEFFTKCFNILKEEYFKNLGNVNIYKLIKEYYVNYNSQPNIDAIATMIKNVPNAEVRNAIVESLKEISKVDQNKNTQFMIDETIKFIKDSLCYKAIEIGADGLQSKDETKIKKAQQILEDMAKVQIDSDLGLPFDDIERIIEYYSQRNYGIKTQHKAFNYRLGGGFTPGTLNVILAPQGVGKSLLMCDFISGMIQDKKNVLMISLEMSPFEMVKRIQANVFDIDVNSFSDLSKTKGEIDALERNATTKDDIINAYNRFKNSGSCGRLFVKEYPCGSFSALMLKDLVDKYRIEKNVKFDIIFIDYLGIMKSDLVGQNVGLYSYVKSIGEEVRAQAVKLGVPIISASQLNRGSINKSDGVDNSSISDSIGTAMTSDFMAFILQTEEMKTNSEVLIKITKNRYNGKTDSFMMNIDYNKMRFMDLEENKPNIPIMTDFKTPQQQAESKQIVKDAIKEDVKENMRIIKEQDTKITTEEQDILTMLGL